MNTDRPEPTAEEITQAGKEFAALGGKSGKGAAKRRPHAHYVKIGTKAMKARWKGHKKKSYPKRKILK